MTGIPTNGTFDSDSGSTSIKTESFGTLKTSMPLLGTNLTIFLILQGSIQKRQLSQLLLLVHVLIIVNNHQHLLDHIRCGINGSLMITSDDNVKWIIIPIHHLSIATSSGSLLDRSLATNGNFASRLVLHFFLRFAARANDETYKVVGGMLFDRYVDFAGALAFEEGGCDGIRVVGVVVCV